MSKTKPQTEEIIRAAYEENNKTIKTKVSAISNLAIKFPYVDEMISFLEAPSDSLYIWMPNESEILSAIAIIKRPIIILVLAPSPWDNPAINPILVVIAAVAPMLNLFIFNTLFNSTPSINSGQAKKPPDWRFCAKRGFLELMSISRIIFDYISLKLIFRFCLV